MPSFWKNFNLGFLNSLGGHDGYVALDIGSSSIKMVEAAVDKSGYRILNLGILPLPVNGRSWAGRYHEKGPDAETGTGRIRGEY